MRYFVLASLVLVGCSTNIYIVPPIEDSGFQSDASPTNVDAGTSPSDAGSDTGSDSGVGACLGEPDRCTEFPTSDRINCAEMSPPRVAVSDCSSYGPWVGFCEWTVVLDSGARDYRLSFARDSWATTLMSQCTGPDRVWHPL